MFGKEMNREIEWANMHLLGAWPRFTHILDDIR